MYKVWHTFFWTKSGGSWTKITQFQPGRSGTQDSFSWESRYTHTHLLSRELQGYPPVSQHALLCPPPPLTPFGFGLDYTTPAKHEASPSLWPPGARKTEPLLPALHCAPGLRETQGCKAAVSPAYDPYLDRWGTYTPRHKHPMLPKTHILTLLQLTIKDTLFETPLTARRERGSRGWWAEVVIQPIFLLENNSSFIWTLAHGLWLSIQFSFHVPIQNLINKNTPFASETFPSGPLSSLRGVKLRCTDVRKN